jgi:Na+-driven multidrug efflux pump
VFKRGPYDADIIALALPTLGAVLIDPCLSLVDTMFVGRLGAVALGAIGPCTALFNFVFATASCVLMVSTRYAPLMQQ